MTVALRKLIYLCYELDGRTKEQTRRVLLDDCAPELSAGAEASASGAALPVPGSFAVCERGVQLAHASAVASATQETKMRCDLMSSTPHPDLNAGAAGGPTWLACAPQAPIA